MSMVLKPEPAGRTTVTANHPSFRFFKLPKSEIFKFSVNLSNCGQTTWFSKLNTSLTVPKKSQNIAQNNLQHQIFPKKEKKKTSKKKKNKRLWKKGYKSAFGFCICICFCFFFICWKFVERDYCLFENCERNNGGRERRRL